MFTNHKTDNYILNAYVHFQFDNLVLFFQMFVLVIDVIAQKFVSKIECSWKELKEYVSITFSSNCRNCSSSARNSIFLFLSVSSK